MRDGAIVIPVSALRRIFSMLLVLIALVLVVMVVAACEVVVGLGLIVAIFRRKVPLDVDELRELKG